MNWIQKFLVCLCIGLLAIRLFLWYLEKPSYKNGEQIVLTVQLLQEPVEKSNTVRFSVYTPWGLPIFITTRSIESIQIGNTIQIEGSMQIKRVQNHAFYQMAFPKITVLQTQDVLQQTIGSASFFSANLRNRVLSAFERVLSEDSSQLLFGIVFGQAHFSKPLRLAFAQTGMMHVVAASGMNVTLLVGFISGALLKLLRRQYALILSLLFIVFYCVLAGGSASIVRASLMASIAILAAILGRQKSGLYALLVTGWIMLIFSPSLLLSVGFQLSFAATLGILLSEMLFKTKKNSVMGFLNILGLQTTFAAQIATLPILLFSFGMISPWSLVVNALVLWTVPLLLLLGSFAAMTLLVSPILATFLLWLCLPFLWYFLQAVGIFSQFTTITVSQVPWQLITGYYLVLGSIVWIVMIRKTVSSIKQ